MRSLKLTLLGIGLFFGSFSWGLGGPRDSSFVFTLEKCVEYALNNNVDIKNALLEQDISNTTVGETRSEGLPQINGSINYSHNPSIQIQPIPNFIDPAIYRILEAEELATTPNGGDFGELLFGLGNTHSGRADLTITQLLFKGSYFVGLQAARTYRELASKEHVKTKIDVVEGVTKAYYLVLINQERINLMDANYNRLDTLLRETQAMLENGFAERIDVDRIKISYNNLKVQRESTRRLLTVSHILLKYQMGMPINQEIVLDGDLSEINFDFSFEEVEDFNYNNRIEISQLQTNKALTQLDLKNNRVQYLPDLSAFANYGYTMGTNYGDQILNFSDSWFKYAAIGVNLNIPIFDGLSKSYRIQRNKIQMNQLQNQEENLKNSIDLEIRQNRITLQNSIENLEVQRENMELAQGIFNVTTIKYQNGIGSNLEVVEAETTYKEAETNYYQALYDALIAKIDLEKALGILIK